MKTPETIVIQSPTRIDLAGGTLDCAPIDALLSPVTTINIAISIYTEASLTPREDQGIKISSPDLGKTFEFKDLKELLEFEDPSFGFFKEHISFWAPTKGFDLTTKSQSPIGGGLGGSSSLSVSVFKAFDLWQQTDVDPLEAIRLCSGIEAKILSMPTGTQDYFPAYFGGLNIIDYLAGVPALEVIDAETIPFAKNIAVFYTGRSHHSGINNWQVLKSFVDQDPKTVEALEAIKDIAHQFRYALKTEKFDRIPNLIREEYQARILLAETFSSPEIEKISKVATDNGGLATKICGAGGGGCVFIWVEEDTRQPVIDACAKAGFEHLDVDFV